MCRLWIPSNFYPHICPQPKFNPTTFFSPKLHLFFSPHSLFSNFLMSLFFFLIILNNCFDSNKCIVVFGFYYYYYYTEPVTLKEKKWKKKKIFLNLLNMKKNLQFILLFFFFSIFPYQENLSFSVLIFFFIKCIIHKDKVFLNIKQNAYLLNHFFPTVSLAPSPFFVFVTKTCRPRVPNTLMSIPLLWHYFSYLLYEFTLIFL